MFVWVISKNGMLSNSLRGQLENKKIKYIATSKDEVDILKIFQIRDFINKNSISHIINCAAYTDVEKAETEKDLAYAVNVTGVKNLAAVSKDKNIKLIHYSTDYVFDGKSCEPYLETSIRRPINYYGKTKCLSEDIIESVLSNYLIIRTSWLFGFKKVSFPSKMFSLMKENSLLNVVKDQIGKVTFCEDLAEATLNIIDQKGIFNFANRGVVSWYEYAVSILKILKEKGVVLACNKVIPVSSNQFKTVALRPKFSVLDTNKIESLSLIKIRPYLECLKQYFSQEYGIY